MSGHKPEGTKRHKVNKRARFERLKARSKLMKGLTKDPRSGYKRSK